MFEYLSQLTWAHFQADNDLEMLLLPINELLGCNTLN